MIIDASCVNLIVPPIKIGQVNETDVSCASKVGQADAVRLSVQSEIKSRLTIAPEFPRRLYKWEEDCTSIHLYNCLLVHCVFIYCVKHLSVFR